MILNKVPNIFTKVFLVAVILVLAFIVLPTVDAQGVSDKGSPPKVSTEKGIKLVKGNPSVWGAPLDSVEVLDQRTQNSKRFANKDGTFTEVLGNNLHYEISPGSWTDSVLDYKLDANASVMDRHPVYRTVVGSEGITITDRGTGKGIRWITPMRPGVGANKASFRSNGLVWTYSNLDSGVKTEATVIRPQGFKTYSFKYRLQGGAEELTVDSAGNIIGDGFVVPRSFVIGANREIYETSAWVLMPGGRLQFSFNDGILPPEAYPYIIDPSTTFQPDSAGIDTEINISNPTTNYGTSVNLRVGDGDTAGNGVHRSFIKFDLSSIPSSDTVTSATLSLYENSAEDGHGVGSWAVKLQRVRRDWVETEATWNIWKTSNNWSTAGAGNTSSDIYSATTATVTLDGTVANAFIDWSDAQLTSDVQDFVSGALSNYGWRIQAPDIEDAGANRTRNAFSLSDHSTSSQRPKLVVVHASPFTPKAIMF